MNDEKKQDEATATGPVVRVDGLRRHFRRADGAITPAIDGVTLDVAAGEFLVLLGPSGCGKTTLLRSIAGLEHPDAGRIEIGGQTVLDTAARTDVPPERRGLSMMFQSYALWPHMTVAANVAYPLENRRAGRLGKTEIAGRVTEVLELVGIPELARQYPGEMSGGQQQRVALARALVAGDDLVLFDEPLSNVDAKVRERLRVELLAMQRRLGFAAVYVTHDQAEAMELATRIAVMRLGRVEQLGPPREIYERPATRYVASFVGVANEIPGTVALLDGDRAVLDTACGRVTGAAGAGLAEGDPAVAIWRPEDGRLHPAEPDTANRWSAELRISMFAGPHTEHHLTASGLDWRVWSGEAGDPGATWVSVDPSRTRILAADEPAA
ncbi:ABC transporter ATP-binding protein [Actinomadura craniellae]|uniref:ABC transporter ATP-binding protein n=1 Tax=Actinomadura craniellae TaxID=2231787 RepID=A0A365HA67_9ACTN|nr:ABC transporter ATP-binding protein [Actinomadura craniellae]RAY16030.1 ABC transporter ATP-binding protein [Actinomadura craniellae]